MSPDEGRARDRTGTRNLRIDLVAKFNGDKTVNLFLQINPTKTVGNFAFAIESSPLALIL
jgi:hypothetical protein